MTAAGGRAAPVARVLPFALAACGGGADSGSSGDPAAVPAPAQRAFNDGVTDRWPNLPIRVFTNNIAQRDEVTEWTAVTGGLVTFAFVGGRSAADIFFSFTTGGAICGVTTVEFEADGRITSADVRVVRPCSGPPVRQDSDPRGGARHRVLDHTADGA